MHIILSKGLGLFILAGLGLALAQLSAPVAPIITPDLMTKVLKGSKLGDPARYLDMVSPLRTEMAALSPDGKLLAYTVRLNDEIYLYIVEADRPDVLKTKALIYKVSVIETGGGTFQGRGMPLVRWLAWVTPTRLVFETNKPFDRKFGGFGEVTAIDADGSQARILINVFTKLEFAQRDSPNIRVIGLDPERLDSIIVAGHDRLPSIGAFSTIGAGQENTVIMGRSYTISVLTGKLTLISKTETKPTWAMLMDAWGTPRLQCDRSDSGMSQSIYTLQPEDTTQGPSLDEATKLKGFSFSPASTLFGERSVPLGFDAKGDTLYYASNVGRDTFGVYAFDLKSKQRLPLALESREFDLLSPQLHTFDALQFYWLLHNADDLPSGFWMRWPSSRQLVMDRFTQRLAGVRYEGATRTARWLRPELQSVQDWLAANRPGYSAEILEWDESLNRFLVREQGPADSGAFYVLDWKQRTYRQFAHRGLQPEAGAVAQFTPFAFTLPDGSKIDGVLALPRESKLRRIPLVLLCPDEPWQHRGAEYLPEFEALTRMGLAVAIYNGRGTWGHGLKERQKLLQTAEEVQATDVVAVADYLAGKFEVSRNRVALLGKKQGGFVALRALQLHSDRFRCAVTLDATLFTTPIYDALLYGKPLPNDAKGIRERKTTPVIEHPELIKKPVLIVANRGDELNLHASARLHAAVKDRAPDSEFLDLDTNIAAMPETQARQWARIESFLNYVLYDYVVNLGETEFLPDKPPPAKP